MTTVIKIGGSLLENGTSDDLVKSVSAFDSDRKVLVHGGGPAVTNLCRDLGIEPRFVVSPEGIRSRLTDLQTIHAYVMAMRGKVNSEIVLELQKRGVRAFGLSGIDGPTLVAERKKRLLTINERGRKMFIDGGYTGRIVSVDSTVLEQLLGANYMPVIAPIAISLDHEPLNVDGDRAASAVSGGLKADRLLILTDVDGVRIDDRIVSEIRLEDMPVLLKLVGNGMDKKLIAAREALEAGTREVIISSGKLKDPVYSAISDGKGTVIRK